MVGPFIFFDHFGPAEIPAGQGADVRPHPHIGLRDRHLSLSRRDPASRQRGVETDHPAGRRQLDGGGTRHYPFRANARRGPQEAAQRLWASDLGRAAAMPTRTRRRASPTTPAELPVIEGDAARPAHSWPRLRRGLTGEGVQTLLADAELARRAHPLPDDHEERALSSKDRISVAGISYEADR